MIANVFLALILGGGLILAQPSILQDIAHLESSKSNLLQYPTQLTQGIVPKAIHSHNDYWRDVPLLTAVSLGVASVEADVWLVNGELFVGHEPAALAKQRTFDSLYIQPLVHMLGQQNPKNTFTQVANLTTPNGVFDTSSGTPLQLLVDIKTDGTEAMPFILRALEPLRSKGYLTTLENDALKPSAVTVVGTGNTPLESVLALEPRDFFFDAPLTGLGTNSVNVTWSPKIAPIASTDYEVAVGWDGINDIMDAQRQTIKDLVNTAHGFGIKARFWDTPGWPIFARNKVWQELVDNGADWLNADDLEAAGQF
ncbi:Altered inheritance of mitochondria protein 6 [Leucoagaricus sp. SymC.cos]|nr:Altered inheritance of mitochondria protein 6 [Leucoagaricus sp. SymC.cos]